MERLRNDASTDELDEGAIALVEQYKESAEVGVAKKLYGLILEL